MAEQAGGISTPANHGDSSSLRLGVDGVRPPTMPPQAPAQFRMVLVSFLAAGIGLLAGIVAFILYRLIGLFTNLFFFHSWSTAFVSPRYSHLGYWIILIPVIGGIVV